MMSGRGILAAVAAGGLAVSLASVAPAGAGVNWDEPQRVDGRYGWQVQLSDDGETAAWIRVGKRQGPGPVRTAKYKDAKKGWSKSKQVPGAAEIDEMTLSGDGRSLLIKDPTTYAVSARKGGKNKWAAPEPVATSAGSVLGFSLLQAGKISADGRTVIWADGTDAAEEPFFSKPALLKGRTLASDGTWGEEQTLGEILTSTRTLNDGSGWIALSADGTTAVWLDASTSLVSATRNADGTWGIPEPIQAYGSDPNLRDVQLSSNGSRAVWQSNDAAVLTSTRKSDGWAEATYVMQNRVSSVAMAPNGKVVAYGVFDKESRLKWRLQVRRFKSGKWTKPKTLGELSYRGPVVVRNKAVAWTEQIDKPSKLRVSLLRKGKWRTAARVAPKAQSPALSRKADTLAWAGKKAGGIFSVKR